MGLGYSFSPTADQAQQAAAGTVSPPPGGQQSLRTLNFKLPTVTGAASADAMVGGGVPGGISPLLSDRPSGQGATFSSAVLQSVLRTLMGSEGSNAFSALRGPEDTMPSDHGMRIDNGSIGIPVVPRPGGGYDPADSGRADNGPQDYASAPQPRSPFSPPQDKPVSWSAVGAGAVPTTTVRSTEGTAPDAPVGGTPDAPDVPTFRIPDSSVGGGRFPGTWHAMKADEYGGNG